MCESTVFRKDQDGIVSIMTEVISIRKEGGSFVCTNIIGESSTLDDVAMVELDLLRHRIMFERV